MAEFKSEWINRFIAWLQVEDEPEYGDDEEMYLLAESFYNEYPDCPLTFDQLVDGYRRQTLQSWKLV
jgi:hypothetical protein